MAAVSRHELSVSAGVVEAALRRPYVEVGIDALGCCEVAALRLDLCLAISRRGFQGESVLPYVLFDTARDLHLIHAVFFMWDTVKFLISSHHIHTDRHTDKRTY